ncbi:MAG: LemA family protein [Chloroflexi bacterium]|nr:LemA family protein [Chloroflexota bacterium]
MRTLLIALAVLVGLTLLVALPVISTYNSLVRKSQAVDEQWAQVQTQYQRRFDLIPNLVNSTKGFFTQEQRIFELITQARTQYAGARTPNQQAQATNAVESALARLLVIVESNPEIKSQATVAQLMDELAGTENRISVERRRYNQVVRDFNTFIKTFPRNVIVGLFGFTERAYFESASGADAAPKVEL